MKKILLPLEETDRSLKALHYVIRNYTLEEAEVVAMMVDTLGYSLKSEADAAILAGSTKSSEVIKASLEGYKVLTKSALGKTGARITRVARETGADMIIMTKSSKDDMLNSIGSTTEYVLNNAPCDVVIVCENAKSKDEYRGLIYRTATAVVNLRGLLGDKQSECLLPSVNVDCNYHFDVTVGKVRFIIRHITLKPETGILRLWKDRRWQEDLESEPVDISSRPDSRTARLTGLRIVNRDMKKEAVFTFRDYRST